ncbi:gibberellin-regulated protein 1 isoform X2 [Ricinus communis]|uniref:gibberellin-regulated protein 1 isoform X2 n=1 Tax=Ricinus communis TaxID=3988 RepID=UPI000772B100|nr:gibberellin-regulated protein 1 isoform X2 [Ricinus communis]|eukprot:XP_015574062.1 gibberellin-regulated protein 1 isoform X2 [Ricinus communis]
MAPISKPLIASLFISLLVLHLVEADQMEKASLAATSQKKIDCASACKTRCRLASRQRMCHRACGTCCARCNCVPPGTSGNHESCRCYASLLTHGGRLKCP